MIEMELTKEDLELILRSLNESKRVFENYERYPDERFRKEQIAIVEQLMLKIKNLR